MPAALAELQQDISARYLEIVRASALGEEIDPEETLRVCTGMGRSLAQLNDDVERVEQRIAKSREFEDADYSNQIELTKAKKAKALKAYETAKIKYEAAGRVVKESHELYGALTDQLSQLTRAQSDGGRELSAFLQRTGADTDWHSPMNFEPT